MDSANPLNASIISFPRTVLKEDQSVGFEPEMPNPANFEEEVTVYILFSVAATT